MNRADSSNRLRLFVFGVVCCDLFLVFSSACGGVVVADDLAIDLGLDGVALGFMSSGFFIAYAITQPVIGFLCDKAGPVRVSACALVIAAIGSCYVRRPPMDSPRPSWDGSSWATGLSAGFIPGMQVIGAMFPPETFSTYSSLFIAIGNTGSLMGAAPLSWLTTLAGWRPVFRGLAALAVVPPALCLVFAKRQSTRKMPDSDSADELGSYSDLIRSRELWLLALFYVCEIRFSNGFPGSVGSPVYLKRL